MALGGKSVRKILLLLIPFIAAFSFFIVVYFPHLVPTGKFFEADESIGEVAPMMEESFDEQNMQVEDEGGFITGPGDDGGQQQDSGSEEDYIVTEDGSKILKKDVEEYMVLILKKHFRGDKDFGGGPKDFTGMAVTSDSQPCTCERLELHCSSWDEIQRNCGENAPACAHQYPHCKIYAPCGNYLDEGEVVDLTQDEIGDIIDITDSETVSNSNDVWIGCTLAHEQRHTCQEPHDSSCMEEDANDVGLQCVTEAYDTYCSGDGAGWSPSECGRICSDSINLARYVLFEDCLCNTAGRSSEDCCTCTNSCADTESVREMIPPGCNEGYSGNYDAGICDSIAEGDSHSCSFFGGPSNFDAEDCPGVKLECLNEYTTLSEWGEPREGYPKAGDRCLRCNDKKLEIGECKDVWYQTDLDFNLRECNYQDAEKVCEKTCGSQCCGDLDCYKEYIQLYNTQECSLIDAKCNLDTCSCEYEVDCKCPLGYDECQGPTADECFPIKWVGTCNSTSSQLEDLVASFNDDVNYCEGKDYGAGSSVIDVIILSTDNGDCCGDECCGSGESCKCNTIDAKPCCESPGGVGSACCLCSVTSTTTTITSTTTTISCSSDAGGACEGYAAGGCCASCSPGGCSGDWDQEYSWQYSGVDGTWCNDAEVCCCGSST